MSTTFDHTSPDISGPAFWDAIHELQSLGPLVWVESNGGFWAATSYEIVLRMAQDWDTFSSSQGVAHPRLSPEQMPYIMPIDYDPPIQRSYRRQLNPLFTPREMAGHEESIRSIADELIDPFIGRGSCDIVAEFARKFPGTVFFRLIVCCGDDDFRAIEPVARTMTFTTDGDERAAASRAFRSWAARVLEGSKEGPEASEVVDAVRCLGERGETLTDDQCRSGLAILAQGGIGTSASLLGAAMRFMAEDRSLQERVRADLSLVPALMEESLRLEPPLPITFRTVTRDVEIGEKHLAAGDKVALLFGAANRDPAVYEHPDDVDIDRARQRHVAFGAGPHRCIGSNLARLQVRVALEQLIARLSPFWIPDRSQLQYASKQARGLLSMPLAFAPSQ